jgi:hypothetical protein
MVGISRTAKDRKKAVSTFGTKMAMKNIKNESNW